jgi:hypothetical protein
MASVSRSYQTRRSEPFDQKSWPAYYFSRLSRGWLSTQTMIDSSHVAVDVRARLAGQDGVRRVGSQPHLFHFDGQDPTKMLPVHGSPRKLAILAKPAAPPAEPEDESPRITCRVRSITPLPVSGTAGCDMLVGVVTLVSQLPSKVILLGQICQWCVHLLHAFVCRRGRMCKSQRSLTPEFNT